MTKDLIADSMEKLVKAVPYDKISISRICSETHISRSTFYYYFKEKEEVLAYVCKRDFEKNSLPFHHISVENISTESFFRYLYDNRELYFAIYDIDQGSMLYKVLMMAQRNVATPDYIERFENQSAGKAQKIINKNEKLDEHLFWLYGSGGIVSVQVYWIGTHMEMPIKLIANQLNTLLMNSLFKNLKDNIF